MGFEDFQYLGSWSLSIYIGHPISSASEPQGALRIYQWGISISNKDGGGILLYDPNGLRLRSPPLPVPVAVPPIYASFRASFLVIAYPPPIYYSFPRCDYFKWVNLQRENVSTFPVRLQCRVRSWGWSQSGLHMPP
jgi:hypothetical protein